MALLALAMGFAVLLNVANVVGRYAFSAPITAADEIMTYTMVWGVFVGAGVVTLRGTHLTMDLVIARLPPGVARALDAAATLAMLLVLGFVLRQSLEYIDTIGAIGLTSMAAGLPMAWVHLAIPLGLGLMMLAAVARLLLGPAVRSTIE